MLDQLFVAERVFPEATRHQAKMPICERLAGRAEIALLADDVVAEHLLGLVTTARLVCERS
jgi:hypothetical protein